MSRNQATPYPNAARVSEPASQVAADTAPAVSSTASAPYQLRTASSVTASAASSSDSSSVMRCAASSQAAPTPSSDGAGYPAIVVSTIPGPSRLPRETVSPEVSACSRMPCSRRPVSSEASACPPSCAMVMAIRVSRHARGLVTSSSAAAAPMTTAQPRGSACVPVSRAQKSATAHRVCAARNARPVLWLAHRPKPVRNREAPDTGV